MLEKLLVTAKDIECFTIININEQNYLITEVHRPFSFFSYQVVFIVGYSIKNPSTILKKAFLYEKINKRDNSLENLKYNNIGSIVPNTQ